jgi:tRNA 2-thiouridine synthesizing protein A
VIRENDTSTSDGDAERTSAVIAAVERTSGTTCSACERTICGHEVVLSFVLGFKGAPRCLDCLARGLGRERAELRDSMKEHVDHRECWRAGWNRASELEGFARDATPACMTRPPLTTTSRACGAKPQDVAVASPTPPASRRADSPAPAARWDAGDLGCGDLVLELRNRMNALAPGAIFELTARDPGAPADLPAWCKLTGHTLLSARHPEYRIRRRDG